jgi:hypothetical protein
MIGNTKKESQKSAAFLAMVDAVSQLTVELDRTAILQTSPTRSAPARLGKPAAAQGTAFISPQRVDSCVRSQVSERKVSQTKARTSCECLGRVYNEQISEPQKARLLHLERLETTQQALGDADANLLESIKPANRVANRQCFGGQRVLPE